MKTILITTLLSSLFAFNLFAAENQQQQSQKPPKVVLKPSDIYTHLKPMKGKLEGKSSKELWLKFTGTSQCQKGFCADGIPVLALKNALNYYLSRAAIVKNHEYLGIVDFSINSIKERFFILNLKTGEVEKMLVTHARNTETQLGVAGKFSNVVGSEMSSLGFFLTDSEHYVGKHGISLKLDGLSATNSNARERAVVIHGADYATQWFADMKGRLGHSQGCPAVSPAKIEGVIEKLKGQALLYLHK